MKQILILTGAGLSAESGLSTFRNNEDGLWTKYNPDRIANLLTFEQNIEEVFKFYNERRIALPSVKPNLAHLGLADIQEKYGPDRVKIYTQNIDNLLEQAGCSEVVHIHGEITKMKCLECKHTWDIGYTECHIGECCTACQSLNIKPGVIFFNEEAPEYGAMFELFKQSLEDIIIVIGTSGNVINLYQIVANQTHPRKSYAILNNKDYDKTSMINYNLFDERLFMPATQGIIEILKVLEKKVK